MHIVYVYSIHVHSYIFVHIQQYMYIFIIVLMYNINVYIHQNTCAYIMVQVYISLHIHANTAQLCSNGLSHFMSCITLPCQCEFISHYYLFLHPTHSSIAEHDLSLTHKQKELHSGYLAGTGDGAVNRRNKTHKPSRKWDTIDYTVQIQFGRLNAKQTGYPGLFWCENENCQLKDLLKRGR